MVGNWNIEMKLPGYLLEVVVLQHRFDAVSGGKLPCFSNFVQPLYAENKLYFYSDP